MKLKITGRSAIDKTTYQNGSYFIIIWREKMTMFGNYVWVIPLALK